MVAASHPVQRPSNAKVLVVCWHWVAHGYSNRGVAKILGIAEKTAQIHVGNILGKIGVADRMPAAIASIQRGLVHLE